MNRQERIDYIKSKNSRWNIWRIKSPWIRLPVAWVLVSISAAAYTAIIIAGALIGAVEGACDGGRRHVTASDWKALWKASTTWKAAA